MDETNALTVGERIVVHLSQYRHNLGDYVCPPGMAQSGIASSLGISRAHAAIELKRQMAAGRIDVRVAHVTGCPTRRKVYHLTPKGEGLAAVLRERALELPADLTLPDGTREPCIGARALALLRSFGVPERRAILLLLMRRPIDLRLPLARTDERPIPLPPAMSAEARAQEAFQQLFQRPYAWQLEVVQGPPHAPPVAVAA